MEGDAEAARLALASWDGDLRPEGAAPLLYACFRQELARAAFRPVLGDEAWAWAASGGNDGAESLLERRLYDLGTAVPAGVLADALAAAWQRAAEAAGSPDPRRWRWSEVHVCAPAHPLAVAFPDAAAALNPPSFGLGGDNDTIKVASLSIAPAGRLRVKDVSVYRQVIDFSGTPRMSWSIPGGASGVPGSPHRDDQLEGWRSNKLFPAALTVGDAKRMAVEALVLQPPRRKPPLDASRPYTC